MYVKALELSSVYMHIKNFTFGVNSRKITGYNQKHSRSVMIKRIPFLILFNRNTITIPSQIDDRKSAIIVVRLITADS